MPELVDVRPDAVDLLLRAGTTVTLTLEWAPAGVLDGRSFSTTLDGQPLALTVNGDVMTVEADAVLTGQLATNIPVDWVLAEDLGGSSAEPVLIGTWTPSDLPQAVTAKTVQVTQGAATIQVTTAGSTASIVALEKKFHTPHVSVAAGFGEHWREVRELAGSSIRRVHWWGGSLVNGVPGPSDPLTTSMAGLVETGLRDLYGDGGSGYQVWTFATRTGTWAPEIGFASTGGRATAAATMTFTGQRGTTIRLVHRNTNIAGSFRWRVDGGSWMTVTPPVPPGPEPGVATVTGLPDVPHTVEVEWLSGAVVIHGVEAHRDTGIVTARCAIGGRALAEYGRNALTRFDVGITDTSATITSPPPGVFTSAMVDHYLHAVAGSGLPFDAQIIDVTDPETATIHAPATATGLRTVDLTVYPPSSFEIPVQTVGPAFSEGLEMADLLIINAGVNDMANTASAAAGTPSSDLFREGISNLLRGYLREHVGHVWDFTPDVLIVGEHLGNFSDPLNFGPEIIAEARDLALGLGGALINLWTLGRRKWQYWDDLGYFHDTVHLNDLGCQFAADQILDLLTS